MIGRDAEMRERLDPGGCVQIDRVDQGSIDVEDDGFDHNVTVELYLSRRFMCSARFLGSISSNDSTTPCVRVVSPGTPRRSLWARISSWPRRGLSSGRS